MKKNKVNGKGVVKARTEVTSKRVAAIACRVLGDLDKSGNNRFVCVMDSVDARDGLSVTFRSIGTVREFKALAGSVLTQAADKVKGK